MEGEIKKNLIERTNQIKCLCIDAETIAIETILRLDDQDQQLEYINSHISSIDKTLIHTKQHINRLKTITETIIHRFNIKFHRKIYSKFIFYSKNQRKSLSSTLQQRRESCSRSIEDNINLSERIIDERFNDIENVICRLKDKAQHINYQLIEQSNKLNHINDHINKSTIYIEQENNHIQKILQ
ncbi:unnamed protein product [Rotaria sordida]|uniref:t-SNARE coiled-coil homology domain-containing protein n=1 Tax=Rotaria sordida TaxID=392033 RepID=A0A813WZ96_9BILA|nr:unnamed protein product [Rotaria sordida]CAF0857937.1 unnamed protein product [Rotaria sordida]CAF0892001.1 unnamed protein product [Rotaria sordida]